MPRVKIAPSILSADFLRLGSQVRAALKAGADWIHMDLMDGHFVPNLSIGVPIVEALRRIKGAFLDVHLMLERPRKFVGPVAEAGADSITIHVEAKDSVRKCLREIRDIGVQRGLCINPDTPPEAILPFIHEFDHVLIMTVYPGYGGQKIIRHTLPKIRKVRRLLKQSGRDSCDIAVDGGIDSSTVTRCAAAGANVMVAGTSVFRTASMADSIRVLRRLAEEGFKETS